MELRSQVSELKWPGVANTLTTGDIIMNAGDIQAEYDRLGYKRGWTFMMTPEARLRDATHCLVGLNPGDDVKDTDSQAHGHLWSVEAGNAYWNERWRKQGTELSQLQVQVRRLAAVIDVDENKLLAAQFVPFRSGDWKGLGQQRDAIAFGRKLWSWVLATTSARIFICLGNDAAANLRYVANAKPCPNAMKLPTGWGKLTIDSYATTGSGSDRKVIVRVPHLSRFQLFGRQGGSSEIAATSLCKAVLQ